MRVSPGRIRFVELHDSWITTFQLKVGGETEIAFSHLAVYYESDQAGTYDIWSHKAQIVASGVKGFELAGELSDDDYVMDGEINAADGSRLRCEQLIGGASVARIALGFFETGVKVTINCTGAKLVLNEPIEVVGKWSGTL